MRIVGQPEVVCCGPDGVQRLFSRAFPGQGFRVEVSEPDGAVAPVGVCRRYRTGPVVLEPDTNVLSDVWLTLILFGPSSLVSSCPTKLYNKASMSTR